MARGETRVGGERNAQLAGALEGFSKKRGGSIPLTREVQQILIPGTAAATAGNYGIFFTAPAININRYPSTAGRAAAVWQITDVRERHEAAGTDAGAVTVMVMKVPSGTAKAAGTACLAAGISLKATADTNQDAALHATAANSQLVDGDSLALVTTGTLTAVAGVSVTVELSRIG
jgi:hypothetical protein